MVGVCQSRCTGGSPGRCRARRRGPTRCRVRGLRAQRCGRARARATADPAPSPTMRSVTGEREGDPAGRFMAGIRLPGGGRTPTATPATTRAATSAASRYTATTGNCTVEAIGRDGVGRPGGALAGRVRSVAAALVGDQTAMRLGWRWTGRLDRTLSGGCGRLCGSEEHRSPALDGRGGGGCRDGRRARRRPGAAPLPGLEARRGSTRQRVSRALQGRGNLGGGEGIGVGLPG